MNSPICVPSHFFIQVIVVLWEKSVAPALDVIIILLIQKEKYFNKYLISLCCSNMDFLVVASTPNTFRNKYIKRKKLK